MTTEIFFLAGDGSEPTPIDLFPEHILPASDRACLLWPTTDPHAIAVIVDGVTIGSLPRRLAADISAALRALHIFANPVQVAVVSAVDRPALDLPLRTIERINAPAIKPTAHRAGQPQGWPEPKSRPGVQPATSRRQRKPRIKRIAVMRGIGPHVALYWLLGCAIGFGVVIGFGLFAMFLKLLGF